MTPLSDSGIARLVGGLTVAGALAAAATWFLPAPTGLEGHSEVAFALGYAIVFLVSQRAGFLLHWRGHATRISVEEFAIVGGLLILPPVSFVSAIVASAVANQILTRRPLLKASFNVAQYALASSVAAASFVALATALPLVWATLPAPFLYSLVSQGSTALLFSRLERERFPVVFRQRFLAWTFIGGVVGVSLGVAAYALWRLHPIAVLAVVPVFLLLARFGRLTEWAEEEVRVHQSLAEATTRVATTGDFDQVAQALLETCATVFGAGEVRLRLALAAGEPPREWTWNDPAGASGHAIHAPVRFASGEAGEILVGARPGQRHYGSRDKHLLALVAASASAAGQAHRSMLELRETNQRLTNANRELEEFTLWTTHDMREPLRSVGQLAGILHEDLEELHPAEAKELARKIERGAHTLKDRIKALHEFSRIVQEDVPFENVRLAEAWDTAVEGLRARIEESGARIQRPERLPSVRGQRARLEKVFANLIENALKYNDGAGPLVELLAREDGAEWQITVRDNGPGIEPAFRDRAFQLFQRGPGAKQNGSGAGLSIVKRIVEQHGGHVWIEDAPGGGADFRISFPRQKGSRDVPVVLAATISTRIKELV